MTEERKIAFNPSLSAPYGEDTVTSTPNQPTRWYKDFVHGYYRGQTLPPQYVGEFGMIRKDPEDPTCYLVQFNNMILAKAFGWHKISKEEMVLIEEFE